MERCMILVALLMPIWSNAQFSLEDLEMAPYQTLKAEKNFEERVYEAKKWACHSKKKKEFISRFMETQYYELFQYISGANEQGARLATTSPVTIKYTKKGDQEISDVCLFIPEKFQEKPPKPKNSQISILEKPRMTVLVRTFGGFANRRETWDREAESLKADLQAAQKDGIIFDYYIAAAYDAPTRARKRRNEVWFMKM